MKYTKFIIAGILALSLTACTSTTNTSEETYSAATESTSAVAEAETSAEEETTTTSEAEAESEATEETTNAAEDVPTDDTANSELIAAYVDILTESINNGVFASPTMTSECTFLPLDINDDGEPELVFLANKYDGYAFDIDGNVLWISTYGDIETADFLLCNKNNQLVWLYKGSSEMSTTPQYIVQEVNGNNTMYVWVDRDGISGAVYNFDEKEYAKYSNVPYYWNNEGDLESLMSISIVDTASTSDDCYALYDNYFGDYTEVESFVWSDKAVPFTQIIKDAAVAKDASTCQDELYTWVETMLTSYYE